MKKLINDLTKGINNLSLYTLIANNDEIETLGLSAKVDLKQSIKSQQLTTITRYYLKEGNSMLLIEEKKDADNKVVSTTIEYKPSNEEYLTLELDKNYLPIHFGHIGFDKEPTVYFVEKLKLLTERLNIVNKDLQKTYNKENEVLNREDVYKRKLSIR